MITADMLPTAMLGFAWLCIVMGVGISITTWRSRRTGDPRTVNRDSQNAVTAAELCACGLFILACLVL